MHYIDDAATALTDIKSDVNKSAISPFVHEVDTMRPVKYRKPPK